MSILEEILTAMFQALPNLCIVLLVGSGLAGLTVGDYAAFGSAYGSFVGAVSAILGVYSAWKSISPEYQRIRFVFDNQPESAGGLTRPETIMGRIDIEHLTFSYEKEGRPILDDLSIHIAPGEYIGIVGASGSGKSTLLKMLLGFLSSDRGRIYYDDMDLANLDKREIRKRMGVVLQNDSLISGSIAENLSITAPGLKQDRMREILERVGMLDDVECMPMGLHTVLDAENTTISGGQKQRLLIARALAADPKIIFFDEATSALDNITQSMVCRTLQELDATRVVIAHRLSTVMQCDRIIVLDHGRIAEEGAYDDLIARNGLFARMAKRQIA